MSHTDARILLVHDRKCALVAGRDADIIMFDDSINIAMTMIMGKIVFQRK